MAGTVAKGGEEQRKREERKGIEELGRKGEGRRWCLDGEQRGVFGIGAGMDVVQVAGGKKRGRKKRSIGGGW